jgi:SAM-dependent methyltransferase
MTLTTPYGPKFFAKNRTNSVRSAEVILPYLFSEIYRPGSICDIGCGAGGFLSVAKQLGVPDVLGIDGPYVAPEDRLIDEFLAVDLATALPKLDREFDLAICLEVGEHLKADRAELLIGALTDLAAVVLFSAAIPGQGGDHHINEQKPSYWIKFFEARDYLAFDCLRWRFWDDPKVAWWYSQNMFLFASIPGLRRLRNVERFSCSSGSPFLHLVHPSNFEKHRGLAKS